MVSPRQVAGWLAEAVSPTPLVTAGSLALVLTVAGYAGLLGLPLALMFLWGFGNYLFEVVEHRALGRVDWPVISVETFTSLRRQLWLVEAGVVALAVAAYIGLKRLDVTPLEHLFALLALLSLPASIALLSVTRNPLKAMSPVHLAATVAKLGLDYLLLLGLAAATLYSAVRLISGIGFFNWLAGMLCVLLLFNVIGHVVYSRRLELGLNPVRSPELALARRQQQLARERSKTLNHVYGVISRGGGAQGFDELRKYLMAQEQDSLEARIWFFKRMADWEDPTPALGFGANLIGRLVGAGDLCTAHKILLRCRHLDPEFQVPSRDQAVLTQWIEAGRSLDLSRP